MAELSIEQTEVVEQSLAELKQHRSEIQSIISTLQFELDWTGKIEDKLKKLLPLENRFNQLFK